jgi:hypothetical protein
MAAYWPSRKSIVTYDARLPLISLIRKLAENVNEYNSIQSGIF